ncbi:MAG TPA: hypothetical protein VGR71_02805 [Nitrospira sp.]|nr:hypothetical protein [Nitrospira sp.]
MVLTRFENVQVTLENVHKLLKPGEVIAVDHRGDVFLLRDTGHYTAPSQHEFVYESKDSIIKEFQRRLDAGSSI